MPKLLTGFERKLWRDGLRTMQLTPNNSNLLRSAAVCAAPAAAVAYSLSFDETQLLRLVETDTAALRLLIENCCQLPTTATTERHNHPKLASLRTSC